jgi:hypothetical protein
MLMHNKILEINPDICLIQEIWTFTDEVLGDQYDILGQNDCIGVKKSFGKIVPGSFKSHSIRFKKSVTEPIYPDLKAEHGLEQYERQKIQLQKNPYDGKPSSPYGIPVDFDITTAEIHPIQGENFMVANVHVRSGSWNDKIRAKQLKEWLLEDFISETMNKVQGRCLIGGDFNHDELKVPKSDSSLIIQKILATSGMNDASFNNREVTTNYIRLFSNWRYDHLMGTAQFDSYQVQQSLTDDDFQKFRKAHRITWWMHIDHKNVSVNFQFL